MSDAIYDVRQDQYTTVIREMIRHGEGFISNAFAVVGRGSASAVFMLSFTRILVTLSAFLMLYKSYQA